MRRIRSLTLRMLLAAAVWSVVSLAIAGIVLVQLYRAAGERAFDERIDFYVTVVIGALAGVADRPDGAEDDDTASGTGQTETGQADADAAEVGDMSSASIDLPGEPRFRVPLSGWYWTVTDKASGTVLFASPSLLGDTLSLPKVTSGDGAWKGYATGPGGEEVRVRQRVINFGPERGYVVAVAGETSALSREISKFARQVAITLSVFALGLLGAGLLQVKVGTRPLARLRASFAAVRRGDAEKIDEDLPKELAPLAIELNALIQVNKETVERARGHVGNLAHALKTPLSVITNEARAARGPLAEKVAEQSAIMRTQIEHHLERASMAAQRRVIGVATDVAPVAERLVRAMTKIHGARGLDVIADVPSGLRFRGEKQDLEEMLGNLLDNACKWANSVVSLSVRQVDGEREGRPQLALVVEDDGPGLSEEEREVAVKRGKRLDETVPGSGLGLSIVSELAGLYGGRLTLDEAGLGGLQTRLDLPAASDDV